ncbi:DUF3027 domain-containing protein [Nocardia lasii]|uniref:DUF3027 domain-containing protein n=1 Tax=Nocardia lasii TaxID=1616107 RepID=A0ABW1JMH2_9NOCA
MSAVSVSESGVRPVLADAAEVARRALVALEPHGVGVHLGVSAEDDTAATHRFEATLPGYLGWQWAVVVAAPPGADRATVSESALLPALDALIAPAFVPWEQRVRPGDLGPGDLLAPPADDPRLVPGYIATGDPVVDEVAREVGLGRVQVLSVEGRADAAERWYAEYGPDTDMAKAAPSTCGLCGFYLPLAGALRESFGVCGNAMGADGHVVNIAYGCGAHSDVVAPSGNGSPLYEAFDDHAVDFVEIARPAVEAAIEVAEESATVAVVDTAAVGLESAAGQDAVANGEGVESAPAVEVVAESTADPAIEVVEVSATVEPAEVVGDQVDAVVADQGAAGTLSVTAEVAPEPEAAGASTVAVEDVASRVGAEVSAEVGEVVAEQGGAEVLTAAGEVVAERGGADVSAEVGEVVAEQGGVEVLTAAGDVVAERGGADALAEVGEVAAEWAGDRQETAEAEAVAAVEAERSALAEGALPESADAVIAAEVLPVAETDAEGVESGAVAADSVLAEATPSDSVGDVVEGDASVEAVADAEASAVGVESEGGAADSAELRGSSVSR